MRKALLLRSSSTARLDTDEDVEFSYGAKIVAGGTAYRGRVRNRTPARVSSPWYVRALGGFGLSTSGE